MTEWSMMEDGESFIDPAKVPARKSPSRLRRVKTSNELQCLFYKLLQSFLNEICGIDVRSSPIPPVLGDDMSIDLLKLFLLVRQNGGYNAITKNGLWDMVAKESGHGLKLAATVKLVYVKYLDALDLWLDKVVYKHGNEASDFEFAGDEAARKLVANFRDFLLVALDSKEFNPKCEATMVGQMDSSGRAEYVVVDDDDESMQVDLTKKDVNSEDVRNGNLESNTIYPSDIGVKGEEFDPILGINWSERMMESVDCHVNKKWNDGDNNEEVIELDSDCLETKFSPSKSNRESVPKMLNWLLGIARNPCDPLVGSLPERSKWLPYSNAELWKQVLMVRDGLCLVRHANTTTEQSVLQKNQKMLPCMYDDHILYGYNLRERLKCTKEFQEGKTLSQASRPRSSSPGMQTESPSGPEGLGDSNSSAETTMLDLPVKKHIPVGTRFQAEVPEWIDLVSESDAKWIGTRVWPTDSIDKRFIVEREPIGKGRQNTCGCQVPNSVECVWFHITERKSRMKRELGQAFSHWRFDKIGEEVACSWTEAEEKKFKFLMKSTTSSLAKHKWDEMIKFFPTKSKEDLVSYYYNVFLLQQRAQQNRKNPENIDSGDEDEHDQDVLGNGFVKLPVSSSSAKKRRKTVG